MNKIVKVIFTLVLAGMIMVSFSTMSMATSPAAMVHDGSGGAGSGSEATRAIDSFSNKAGYQSDEMNGVQKIAQKVLTAIRNIAIIVAVIMISILGIQYMVGSAEQKASYKKAFIPLIVGAILVVSAAQIAKMLFSLSA